MVEFQNSLVATGTSGCMLVSVLAENVTTGVTAYFTFKPAVPEKGLSIDNATLSNREKESEAWNYCDGRVGGLNYGNNTYGEKMLDFTVGDDFAVSVVNVDPTVSYSVLENMIMGGVLTYGGVKWNILGNQGVRALEITTDKQDFMYFLYEDGKVINPNRKRNDGTGFITSDNAFVVQDAPVCTFETKYAVSSSNIKGERIAYALGLSTTFNEGTGTSSNNIGISAKRLCDVTHHEKYLGEGLSFVQELQTAGTDAVSRVEVKMIIEESTGNPPAVAGVVGDQLAVVNPTDGTVEIYKHDGTDFVTVPVTSVLAKGAKIFAPTVADNVAGTSAVTKNAYITIKTAGATGSAVATNWKTNDGTGVITYVLEILTWDYEAGDFALVAGKI